MTPAGVGVGTALAVLLVALLVGVAAGRSRRRWYLLLVGLIAVTVLGAVAAAVTNGPGQDLGVGRAGDIAKLYTTVVPLAVTFAAGWLCGRATWFRRLIVLAAAALLLVAFPYAAAGRATSDMMGERGPAATASPRG